MTAVRCAAALLGLGAMARRPRLRQVGLAALVAVAASGLLANLVKLLVELPRPNPEHESYGFPSGHTMTAFALAIVALAFAAQGLQCLCL